MGVLAGLRRRLAAMIDPEEAKWQRLRDRAGLRLGGTSTAGKHVTPETAMRLSAVWACIRLTSQAIASLPIGVYRRGRDNSREEANDTREAEILRVSPNPDQTALEFWETMVAWQAATGEGYAEIMRTGSRLAALVPLDSTRVAPTRDRSGNRVYRVTDDQGRNDVLSRDRIFRLPWMDLGRDRGLSPIRYGVNTMGAAMGADEAAAKLFGQGLLASGFVSTDGILKDTQREQLQKMLEEFTGSERAWKIQLLEAGLKWEGITLNPDDAQLLETRRFHVEDIARWFGVPPIIIGHAAQGQTMWGSGVEQILLAWLALGINPLARRIEARVRKQLLTGTGLELEFNREGLLQMDSAAKASFLSSMVQNALMSRNEARGKLNLPRREGADALTAQTNLAPLEQLGRGDDGNSARNALLAWLGIDTSARPKETANDE